MNRYFLTWCLFFCAFDISAQLILERQVISCMSLNMCSDYCIYSTAGQPEFHTFSSGESIITAGFEQPNGPMSMTAVLNVTHQLCDDTYTVTVTDLSECGENDSVQFYWNGVAGSNIQGGLQVQTTLNIQSSEGCEYSTVLDFMTMEVTEVPCALEFYSYFSPNSDGDNDVWVIGNIDQESFSGNEVTIFNRWGGMVWKTSNYNNDEAAWNGTNQSEEPLPDGTYFYVVKAGGKEYNGYVELMR